MEWIKRVSTSGRYGDIRRIIINRYIFIYYQLQYIPIYKRVIYTHHHPHTQARTHIHTHIPFHHSNSSPSSFDRLPSPLCIRKRFRLSSCITCRMAIFCIDSTHPIAVALLLASNFKVRLPSI